MDVKLEQVSANLLGKCLKFVSLFSAKMEKAEADMEKTTTDCTIHQYMARKFYLQNEFYDVFCFWSLGYEKYVYI